MFFQRKNSYLILGLLSIMASSLAVISFWSIGISDMQAETVAARFGKSRNSTGLPLSLPQGFLISVYAKKLDNPEAMTWDRKGNLLVALPKDGKIIAIKDANKDGLVDGRYVVVDEVFGVKRLTVKCEEDGSCKLYVATARNTILFDYNDERLLARNRANLSSDAYGSGLFARYAVADDSIEYCDNDFLAQHPMLNIFCSQPNEAFAFTSPDHTDSSMVIIPANGWPEDYKHDVLVAYPGTKNLGNPTGYKVVRYKFDKDKNYLGQEDFITGWLGDNDKVLGSPTGLLIGPANRSYITDLYISDAGAGVIYRVSYRPNR